MNVLYAYVASLVAGGILLAASLFLGKDTDHGGGAEHGDVGHGEVGHGDGPGHALELHGDGHDLGAFWLPFLSFRFWVFFLCFFGLSGTLLSLLSDLPRWLALLSAIGTGGGVGFAGAWTIERLKRTEVGRVPGEQDFKGLEGAVLLPLPEEGTGKVRLSVRGQHVDLPARSADRLALPPGSRVLVIDYKDHALEVVRSPDGGEPEGGD
ncbi:MAG: AbrB/MazE/SpoVT family DNA-binding domain-containing protein [Deltaproteobacteria bacterium]|nr:AbrB/MazE/SpoVT family DNA-binding domain-containing protein [Deltaproteobacteria bacterium]